MDERSSWGANCRSGSQQIPSICEARKTAKKHFDTANIPSSPPLLFYIKDGLQREACKFRFLAVISILFSRSRITWMKKWRRSNIADVDISVFLNGSWWQSGLSEVTTAPLDWQGKHMAFCLTLSGPIMTGWICWYPSWRKIDYKVLHRSNTFIIATGGHLVPNSTEQMYIWRVPAGFLSIHTHVSQQNF